MVGKIRGFFKMKRICIVGIGWLGEDLAIAARKQGHYVIGTTSSFARVEVLKEIVDELVVFNLKKDVFEVPSSFDVLIYTIPPSSSASYGQLSCSFFTKVLEMNPDTTVIYTSSTSVYGTAEREVNEQSLIDPSSNSATKIVEVEQCVQQNFEKWAIVRLGGLVGGKRHPVKFLAGRKGVSKPLAPVNLLHREDAVGAILHLLSNFKRGIYNLCSENHPLKNRFYTAVAKQYRLKAIEFDAANISKDKIVTCETIKKSGFKFKYPSPYDFPFEL